MSFLGIFKKCIHFDKNEPFLYLKVLDRVVYFKRFYFIIWISKILATLWVKVCLLFVKKPLLYLFNIKIGINRKTLIVHEFVFFKLEIK